MTLSNTTIQENLDHITNNNKKWSSIITLKDIPSDKFKSLTKRNKHAHWHIRFYLVKRLVTINNPSIIEPLLECYQLPNNIIKKILEEKLLEFNTDSIPFLIPLLENSSLHLRQLASETLYKIGNIEKLKQTLTKTNWAIANQLLNLIYKLDPSNETHILTGFQNPATIKATILLCGLQKNKQAIQTLSTLVAIKKYKKIASLALKKITAKHT